MSPHPRFRAIAGDLVFTEVRFLLLLQLQSQFSHWDALPRPCGCGIEDNTMDTMHRCSGPAKTNINVCSWLGFRYWYRYVRSIMIVGELKNQLMGPGIVELNVHWDHQPWFQLNSQVWSRPVRQANRDKIISFNHPTYCGWKKSCTLDGRAPWQLVDLIGFNVD